MRDRSYLNSLTALCLMIVITGLLGLACGGSSNQVNTNTALGTPTPTPDPCASVTDEMMVNMIYGELIRNPEILPLIKQINVAAKAGMVTLVGWVPDSAKKAKIIGIVENTTCVKKPVDVANFQDHSGPPSQPSPGCVPPLERCGDICVPPGQCAWLFDTATTGNTNTKANTTSGANTKTNMKTNTNTTVNTNTMTNTNGNTKY